LLESQICFTIFFPYQRDDPLRILLTLVSIFLSTVAQADLLITGGTIYTMNEHQPQVEAVLVRDDRIVFSGGLKAAQLLAKKPQMIHLKGRTMTPGIIESHGHLMSLGFSKLNLDLSGAGTYQDIVDQVADAVAEAEPGQWILGRGWHQSKWFPQPEMMVGGFQTHDSLSAVSPDNPVYLVHASGHAAMANARAMEIAGVHSETDFEGDGEIIKDAKLQPTGIFNEVAQRLISTHVPPPDDSQRARALRLALEELGANGITSFQDAGTSREDITLFKSFLKQKALSARVWVMLSGRDQELLLDWFRSGPEIGLGDERLTIRAIKLVADGALGSRGAWLLEPYSDRPGHVGLPTMSVADMTRFSQRAFETNFQIGIHAIGDRGNREVLDIFDEIFDGKNQGVRFRVEHAQHLSAADIPRFGELGVIASVQGIHMSSDRPWAIDRLGIERIEEGAYVWRKLWDTGAIVINGTDVPVEPINPINSYYSLVTRQTLAGEPKGGFEPSQKLTRMEALKTYTLDAAYGAFEEHLKGSIEQGKLADFTVFDQDLLTVPDNKILDTKVSMTIVGGKTVFDAAL
jgi:predicted amidohydrolase YtcJ